MPEWSSYNYGFSNPIIWTDPTRTDPKSGQTSTSASGVGFVSGVGTPWNPSHVFAPPRKNQKGCPGKGSLHDPMSSN